MDKIKIGILGYGNLGKGAEIACSRQADIELVGVFSRRNPSEIVTATGAKVYSINELDNFIGKIDVMMLCGGSATDLEKQSAEYIKNFNTVDSFDTHAKIPDYFDNLDKLGKEYGHLGGMSIGWDPGLFSLARALFGAVLPSGNDYTFWGKGVSQGHSDAIRRIDGVKNAIQYTVPIDSAVEAVRNHENPTFTARQKHTRECYVVTAENADKAKIEKQIKEMPNYFADYNTTVHFITEQELKENHSKLAHGGFVIRSGNTSAENSHLLELSIKLGSNPEFTGSVLTAYARAISHLAKEGKTGALTALDIPISYLSAETGAALRKKLV